MDKKQDVKIQNKKGKPINILEKEQEIFEECSEIERLLPRFLNGFFIYLRGSVLPMTRLAYLNDIKFFCEYLVESEGVYEKISELKISDFEKLKARDINIFLDYARRYEKSKGDTVFVFENSNRTLARKKSSITVLFKQLFRDELISKNITDNLDPIKVPRPNEREIKALTDDEVRYMLHIVETGDENIMTKKQHEYWKKTKKRDKAILILFITYGLRLSELEQLNVESFNFDRGEFKIYRKRGKESIMPINLSCEKVLKEYLEEERIQYELEENKENPLFLSLQKKRMTARQIRDMVKKYTAYALKTSQKSGFSPHKLRATAATSLIGRGEDIYDVQVLLDHENVTTTQLYAKHKENVKRDLVKNMEWELEKK